MPGVSSSHAASAPAVAEGDLGIDAAPRCFRCAYVLHGLDPAGLCPECATSIRDSIVAHTAEVRRYRRVVYSSAELLQASSYAAFAAAPAALVGMIVPIFIPVVGLIAIVAFGLFASGGFGLPSSNKISQRKQNNRLMLFWTLAPFVSFMLMIIVGPAGLVPLAVSFGGLHFTVLRRTIRVASLFGKNRIARQLRAYHIGMIAYFVVVTLGALVVALNLWASFQSVYGASAPPWLPMISALTTIFALAVMPWATLAAMIGWLVMARRFCRGLRGLAAGDTGSSATV
ncbi:MAG: hypothetical protein JNG88_09145 [Phycisphaerales bacterium]|nr:hypothetical protein [Phycisphaerales bacterium]